MEDQLTNYILFILNYYTSQDGKEYYIVKNSWGTTNDYKGYLYVTKNFIKYKTTAFMVNKAAIPATIAKKMGV